MDSSAVVRFFTDGVIGDVRTLCGSRLTRTQILAQEYVQFLDLYHAVSRVTISVALLHFVKQLSLLLPASSFVCKTDPPTSSLFARTKQHCLIGIRGTVRRSTDSWFVHCNVGGSHRNLFSDLI